LVVESAELGVVHDLSSSCRDGLVGMQPIET